ncbi:MAG: hypothetical protein CMA77_04255 [Euryarchaeota archaeon]|nr:hypothetical protein [Euryarchaeota archaeon]
MPVLDPPEDDPIGPYRRLSYSQSDTHRRCPRMWYHRYVLGLLGGTPPIFAMGHAVEGALNRVMRDCPALVASDAPSETFDSPLDEYDNGAGNMVLRPSTHSDAKWPALRIMPLPKSVWPNNRKAMTEWAKARAERHFEREWNIARESWEEDPNRIGDWDSFEDARKEDALEMVYAGIEFHLDEVEDCISAKGGPFFENWRIGKHRPKWPAPDGLPYNYSKPHICAESEGEITWNEAWEVARPWFCDPDAGLFALSAVHPEGWLQGEYDLVYRWTGEIRIHDVKASLGTSDFSFGYPEQLATYAYLWWATHERREMVTELEIWYLGVPVRKKIPLPDEDALLRLERRLKILHQNLKLTEKHLERNFPGTPAPVRAFLPGGEFSDVEPKVGMARCESCDYQTICSDSPLEKELPTGGERRFAVSSQAKVNCTPISEIYPFVTLFGTVREPNMVKQWPTFEKEYLEFFLDLGPNEWVAVVVKKDDPELPSEFEHGAMIRIKRGIVASGWRKDLGNHIRIDLSFSSSIEIATSSKGGDARFADLRPYSYNINAKIFNFDHRENKWGSRLIDSSGTIAFQLWGGEEKANSLLEGYSPERGDEVVLVGARAKDQFGKIVLEGRVTKNFSTRLRPAPEND